MLAIKNNVLKFKDIQNQKIARDRRKAQRVLVDNILYAFVVLPEKGLLKVDPMDLSETGIGFALPEFYGTFRVGETYAFRLYFTQEDYLPLIIQVVRRERLKDESPVKLFYGCELKVDAHVTACVRSLVTFVQSYAEVSKFDHGDKRIYLP